MTASEIIAKCRLFNGLTDEQRARLAAEAVVVRLRKNQRVFAEGAPCPGLYVVGSGLVRVYKLAPTGKEHVLHFVEPGMTFAEVAAMGGFACPANAEAVEPSTCALLPTDRFQRLLHADHPLCLQLLVGMSLWVKHLIGLLEDIVLRDATARVARHLVQSAVAAGTHDFTLPMLKKDLASHLNLTGETLSRTLRRLADTGLIELQATQRIRVLAADALRDVAAGLPPGEFD